MTQIVPPPSVPAPEAEEQQDAPRERRRLPRSPRQALAAARAGARTALDSDAVRAARKGIARGARAVVPVLAPVTRLGWVSLGITIAALVIGLSLQWTELVVIAIAGGVLIAIAIAYIVGRTMYRIELDLAYTRVVVGERALGRIEIHSASSRPLMPATIEVPVGSAVASFHLPRMQPRDVHEDVFAIPTSRRAVLRVGPVRSVKGDPLGLLRRQVRWTEAVELFVHPRTVQLDETAPGLIRDLEGITTRDLTNSDIAFHALRDYVAGDDRRYIHWKSSARTGQLMVRQFEQTRRSVLALGLSTNPDDYGDPDEFETAISVLGSLGLQAIRDEMDVVVRTSRRPLPATNGKRLLDGLSGVASSPRHDRLVGLAAEIGREHPGASVVMLHAGRGVDLATVRRATALLPSQARILVIQAVAGAKARVQPLGAATLAQLPSIAELPRIVRAVSEQ